MEVVDPGASTATKVASAERAASITGPASGHGTSRAVPVTRSPLGSTSAIATVMGPSAGIGRSA